MKMNFFQKNFLLFFFAFMGLSGCVNASPANSSPGAVTSSGFECPEPEFPSEVNSTEINLFTRMDSIPPDVIECFSLTHDVKVNLYEYTSDEEMYVKISAGSVEYDLIQPSGRIIPLMLSNMQLQELDHERLPVLVNLDSNYLHLVFDPDNRYSVPYQAGSYAILVNTDRIEHPPVTWADLWNKEYLQRMIVANDGRVVIGMALLELGYDVNTTDSLQLQAARDRLWELVPNIQVFDSEDPKASLIAGKVDLGIVRSTDAYFVLREDSAFQYIYPSEGAILWQDNWAILANAIHSDAAYAWINYTMQGNVHWLTMRDLHITSPNLAALEFTRNNKDKLYESYIHSPIINIPLEALRNGHHLIDVGETTTLYDNIWVEIKGE